MLDFATLAWYLKLSSLVGQLAPIEMDIKQALVASGEAVNGKLSNLAAVVGG